MKNVYAWAALAGLAWGCGDTAVTPPPASTGPAPSAAAPAQANAEAKTITLSISGMT